jgi:hypothetical protein
MIQRVQTLYLLSTVIISVIFLAGNIIEFTIDNESAVRITLAGVYDTVNGNNGEHTEKFLLFSAASALIPLVFLAAIFLYKQRIIQLKTILAGIFLVIIMIAVLVYISAGIIGNRNVEIILSVKMIFPPVMLLLAILAYRAVKKDERLVKSYERLR